MRIVVITAVEAERAALEGLDVEVIAGGLGRTNAAATTTEILIADPSIDLVISAGVAGSLPGGDLDLGRTIVGDVCIYAEEGLLDPDGFRDITALGFALGDFAGNAVPVDPSTLDVLSRLFRAGPIATVATCSGTDAQATLVRERTGAIAEAMEGAAVVHAARRRGVPAIEIRTISNTTGDRPHQRWDLPGALAALGRDLRAAVDLLRE